MFLFACLDERQETPSPSRLYSDSRCAFQAHPASNYSVKITKDDWEHISTFTGTLISGDRKRILEAFSEHRQRTQAGFYFGLAVNTVMKNGTIEQRALVDDLITALCKVAEGSETTELYLAHPLLVGATQTAFEAAGASGPGSIPPEKNVLAWWKASKVRSLLVAK